MTNTEKPRSRRIHIYDLAQLINQNPVGRQFHQPLVTFLALAQGLFGLMIACRTASFSYRRREQEVLAFSVTCQAFMLLSSGGSQSATIQ